jgi:ribosomal protein S18 acetylase RimI-like enzyme
VVLDLGQGIAGYASYGRCRDRSLPADGEVDELYLLPEYQGIGLGRRLFKAVLNDLRHGEMRRVVVWALAENERACAFYEGLGGRSIARIEERIGGTPLGKVAYLFR